MVLSITLTINDESRTEKCKFDFSTVKYSQNKIRFIIKP